MIDWKRNGPSMTSKPYGATIGAYGIANEQKWGYTVAVGASILQILLLFAWAGSATFTELGPLLDLIFYGALVALLLHPMSRDYQRIWFK